MSLFKNKTYKDFARKGYFADFVLGLPARDFKSEAFMNNTSPLENPTDRNEFRRKLPWENYLFNIKVEGYNDVENILNITAVYIDLGLQYIGLPPQRLDYLEDTFFTATCESADSEHQFPICPCGSGDYGGLPGISFRFDQVEYNLKPAQYTMPPRISFEYESPYCTLMLSNSSIYHDSNNPVLGQTFFNNYELYVSFEEPNDEKGNQQVLIAVGVGHIINHWENLRGATMFFLVNIIWLAGYVAYLTFVKSRSIKRYVELDQGT